MLRSMRRYATGWMIKIILGAIVVVFVFWGVGSFRAQRGGRVALVNGESIAMDEYKEAYNNLIDQLRKRFGNSLNDDMIKMLQVKNQALDQLINQKLLLQETAKLNFRVSDNELADAIRKIEAFQTAGVFDDRLYRNVLSRYRLTPEEFEAVQRESMLIEKLKSFISGSIKVSDQEAMEWFKWNNALVDIDFVLFEPGRYKDIKPSDEEINAFFDNRKDSYKTDSMIKARFLHFDPDTYRSRVKITDEEIEEYYEANQEKFKRPKTVDARHILIKIDQDAGPEVVEKGRIKALDIMKMAREGKNFAELAKEYSECPSKDKGGYLGAFRKETMVRPFADKAFSMKAGEISEPVRTRFGWHIIKVEKVNEESTTSLNEAVSEIRKKLTDERAKNLAYDESEAVYDASFEGDDLVKAAQARNLNILTTDFFTRKGPDKGIKNRAKFASTAFNLSLMEISDIQELGDGYYILQVIEKIPERIPELKDVKEKVVADLVREKQDEKASKDADEFLSALKNGKSMSKESKKFDLTLAATGLFKRNNSIPDIGFEQEIAKAAFKLSNEKRLPESVIKGKKGYYIIRFRERKEPDPEGFDKEKADIKKRLLQQKKLKTFDAWLSQIRDKSDISIKKGFLE